MENKCECGCESNTNTCVCKEHPIKNKKNKKCECNKDEVKKLKEQLQTLNEEVLRSKADLVNYRKRKDEEVVKMYKYCNEDLIKEMLQTVDNFERAIKLDDDKTDESLSKYLEGFKLIYCSLVNTLEKYGVKAIDGSNKPFDPTYHQAVMLEQKDGIEPGMVIEVLQKGYLLKDKVIRPAMVRVSE